MHLFMLIQNYALSFDFDGNTPGKRLDNFSRNIKRVSTVDTFSWQPPVCQREMRFPELVIHQEYDPRRAQATAVIKQYLMSEYCVATKTFVPQGDQAKCEIAPPMRCKAVPDSIVTSHTYTTSKKRIIKISD